MRIEMDIWIGGVQKQKKEQTMHSGVYIFENKIKLKKKVGYYLFCAPFPRIPSSIEIVISLILI